MSRNRAWSALVTLTRLPRALRDAGDEEVQYVVVEVDDKVAAELVEPGAPVVLKVPVVPPHPPQHRRRTMRLTP